MHLIQQSLALFESAGEAWDMAAAARELGELTRLLGQLERAKQMA